MLFSCMEMTLKLSKPWLLEEKENYLCFLQNCSTELSALQPSESEKEEDTAEIF